MYYSEELTLRPFNSPIVCVLVVYSIVTPTSQVEFSIKGLNISRNLNY